MAKSRPALEFKGRMLSLTRVRILDADPVAVEAQLRNFARQLGEAASGLPVLLDAERAVELQPILKAMLAVGVQPIAALDGPLGPAARASGLAVLPLDALIENAPRGAAQAAEDPQAAAPAPVEIRAAPEPAVPPSLPPAAKPARIVTEPVRSGQQIYAEGSDLVIMTTVSPGAEVIADGCVHVYGALRGRAIAGARGNAEARIFCRRMEAELLAVAGIYSVADQMQGELRGKPAQARLTGGTLRIEKLE